MINNKNFLQKILPICLLAVVFISCNKKLKKSTAATDRKVSLNEIYSSWEEDEEFTSFKASMRVSIETPDINQSGSSMLMMKKGEAIWINVSKFGFEAGRVLIRPDSVFILNKLQKECFMASTEELLQAYGIPNDFEYIENLVIGKVPEKKVRNAEIEMDSTSIILNGYDKSGNYDLLYALNYLNYSPSRILIKGKSGVSADFAQSRFRTFNKYGEIPYIRNVNIKSYDSDEYFFSTELQETQFNTDVSMPFTIPKSYDKVYFSP